MWFETWYNFPVRPSSLFEVRFLPFSLLDFFALHCFAQTAWEKAASSQGLLAKWGSLGNSSSSAAHLPWAGGGEGDAESPLLS